MNWESHESSFLGLQLFMNFHEPKLYIYKSDKVAYTEQKNE